MGCGAASGPVAAPRCQGAHAARRPQRRLVRRRAGRGAAGAAAPCAAEFSGRSRGGRCRCRRASAPRSHQMIDPPSLLLDPQVLASIADLEMVARVTVDGSISGLHRSPFHGYSAEFSQYRHYRPGDDLKYVDWKLFARTDRVYTKQYRETTNTAAQLAVDGSGSLGFPRPDGVSD